MSAIARATAANAWLARAWSLSVPRMFMRAAGALVAFVLLSAPARADNAVRVGLPGSIESLVAGPDGGGWIGIDRPRGGAVGHASADGRFRSTALQNVIGEGTLGPDGAAYFGYGGKKLARVDSAGAVTFSGALTRRADDLLGFSLATGPDGRLWTTTLFDGRLARITPGGQA